jgi:hypothetical protein
MNSSARTKTPHDVFVYPISTSTPAQQQPIHARQRYFSYFENFQINLNILVHHLIFIQI